MQLCGSIYSMTNYETEPNNYLTAQETLSAGAEFLSHFGVEADALTQNGQFIESLNQLNPRFQGERELVRFELESDQTEWDDETKTIVMQTAERLRMLVPETPLAGEFDVVISLGAARQANLDRIRYATAARSIGEASYSRLIATGSSRELSDAEKDNTANYAPGAEIEFDLAG